MELTTLMFETLARENDYASILYWGYLDGKNQLQGEPLVEFIETVPLSVLGILLEEPNLEGLITKEYENLRQKHLHPDTSGFLRYMSYQEYVHYLKQIIPDKRVNIENYLDSELVELYRNVKDAESEFNGNFTCRDSRYHAIEEIMGEYDNLIISIHFIIEEGLTEEVREFITLDDLLSLI